jgi:hypothetical protein
MDTRKVCSLLYLIIGVFGLLSLAVSFGLKSGFYYGLIHGRFDLSGSDHSSWDVQFKSKSTPQWKWEKPQNFAYDTIYLEIVNLNGDSSHSHTIHVVIDFPSLMCRDTNGEKLFSSELLAELLKPDIHSLSQQTFLNQIDELYSLIIAAGNGKAPVPRHHIYYYKGGLQGTLVHFDLGGPIYPLIGIFLIAFAVALWITEILKSRLLRQRSFLDVKTE